jgi:hypothetical protein
MKWVVCVVSVLVLGLAACSKSNEMGGTATAPTTTTRVMRWRRYLPGVELSLYHGVRETIGRMQRWDTELLRQPIGHMLVTPRG